MSEGFDAIFTVVDRFYKMVPYIPTRTTATAVDIANLFLTYIWKLHGLPKQIVLDQRTQFAAKFTHALHTRLDIKPTFSTAYHP